MNYDQAAEQLLGLARGKGKRGKRVTSVQLHGRTVSVLRRMYGDGTVPGDEVADWRVCPPGGVPVRFDSLAEALACARRRLDSGAGVHANPTAETA